MSGLMTGFVVSLLNCCLADSIYMLTMKLLYFTKTESSAAEEIAIINKQLEEINPKEELSKYCKLERRKEKFKNDMAAREHAWFSKMKEQCDASRYAVNFIMTIACMVMFYKYRSTPVVILKEEWLEPFSSILSFPTFIPGAISFPVWFMMCNTVIKMAVKVVSRR